jgi:hypothetical protein
VRMMRDYSNTGSRYVVTFVDRKSRMVRVYFVKKKSDVVNKAKHFISWVRNQRGNYPKNLNTDGGGEYVNRELKSFCEELGINLIQTEAYSPEQNGIAERINRTLVEGSYAMLRHAGLPVGFWEEAMNNFVYIKNRTPHTHLQGRRPIDEWNEELGEVEREDLWSVKQFGCRAEVHIPPSRRLGGKDGLKVRTCIFLGKAPGRKTDMFYDYISDKIIYGHSNYFYQKEFPLNPAVNIKSPTNKVDAVVPKSILKRVQFGAGSRSSDKDRKEGGSDSDSAYCNSNYDDDSEEDSSTPDTGSDSEQGGSAPDSEQGSSAPDSEQGSSAPERRYSRRQRDPVNYSERNLKTRLRNEDSDNEEGPEHRYSRRQREPVNYCERNLKTRLEDDYDDIKVLLARATGTVLNDKITRKKMLQGEDKEDFIIGEKEELENGFKTGCLEQVEDVPEGATIYNMMWVYKIKPQTELESLRYRSRLCVLGNRQKPDSYGETFAAVGKVKMFRMLLTLCVYFGMNMTQLDVSNAFMYADLDKEIYVYPPPGYKHLGLLKLNKSLYGLKQAPRLWYDTMKTALEELGFKQLESDVCCFTHPKTRCYLLMYVDDICIVTSDEKFRKRILVHLKKKFKLKHFSEARRYVGLQLEWSKMGKRVRVFQKDYITKVLELFGMNNCKTSEYPTEAGLKLSMNDKVSATMKNRPYRALVGSLLYLLGSRPDVASPIRTCSQFVSVAADTHWRAAKTILRYLAGTRDKGVVYTKENDYNLTAYCDSDFASEEDRRSISGYIIYAQGGPVVWKSKKQPTVALSSCEAEYVSLSETIKELLWMSMALRELGVEQSKPMRIYIDNQAAKRLAENAVNHERSKHIDTRYHFIRQVVAAKKVELIYVDTKENVSDLLTKSTTRSIFSKLVGKLVQ